MTLSSAPNVLPQLLPADLRLIIDDQNTGARNMAVDAALLQSLSHDSPPTMRLYGFSPACVSLGRFQRITDVSQHSLDRLDVDLVRRPTGGKAVLHDDEVTYSMALARHHLEPFTKRRAYRVCAEILLELLRALGVCAEVGGQTAAPTAGSRGADCFRATADFEIVACGRKLVGSAQTTTRQGSLQHGSIPLSDSYRRIAELLADPEPGDRGRPHHVASQVTAPEPTSIEEQTGARWTFEEARDALVTHAVGSAGARWARRVEVRGLEESERAVAYELEGDRYRDAQWTAGRRAHRSPVTM